MAVFTHIGTYSGSRYLVNFVLITVVIISQSEQVCFNISKLTIAGVYLENNLLGVTSVTSMLDCAATCLSQIDCSSFGFEFKTRSCHLHVENSTTADQDLVTKMEWFHSDISLWPQTILGPCVDHHCNMGERCHVHPVASRAVAMTATCVQGDVELPVGYCPVPFKIPNATISHGDQREGSVRIYTCNHGYWDLSRDETSVQTRCFTDGTWSNISFNCSGPYIRVEPPLESNYTFQLLPSDTLQNLTGGTSSLIFLTKSCHDSNFALHSQQTFEFEDVYEVVIGGYGNTRSHIKKCINCERLANHSEHGILSCSEFRPFWLSWKNGIISVGKGNVVGDRIFMSWTPSSPFPINYVSVSSYKNSKGVWLFSPQT